MSTQTAGSDLHAILAKPRGFCAGVERAIKIVELALEQYGAPIYVRKEIVHNSHVVSRLRSEGAVFVDEVDEIPSGAVTILSAHGSSPKVYADAAQRDLKVIDAVCPLVRKVHVEVHRFIKKGYQIILIGHDGHDEVEGTMGQAPDQTTLIEDLADVERFTMDPDRPGIILTQTTLSQDDTAEIMQALQRKYPHLELPPSDDICYATQNRQNAVKEISPEIDLLLVIGSENSSNSKRLTEVAQARGVPGYLIDAPDEINPEWLSGVKRVGISSGASAPEDVVQAVLERLRSLGVGTHAEVDAPDEGVVFTLPKFTPLTKSGKPTEN